MTTTTTTASVSYAYGSYMQLLAVLPDTPTRRGRASLLDQMGDLADQLADGTYGQLAEDDPAGDSIAWREAGSLVRRLAAAERGTTLFVAVPFDDDLDDEDDLNEDDLDSEDGDSETDPDSDDFTDLDLWARLANAATRHEHTTSVHAISEMLLARKTRPHAYEAFMAAATACSIGYPDTYPTRDTRPTRF
jgi:hypothetical protein